MTVDRIELVGGHIEKLGIHIVQLDLAGVDIGLTVARSDHELRNKRRAFEDVNGFRSWREIQLADGATLLVVDRGLEFYHPPLTHHGSGARYHALGFLEGTGVLVQELPEGSQTSYHFHKETPESSVPIYGSPSYEIGPSVIPLTKATRINPWTPHRFWSPRGSAVVVLLMPCDPRDMSDHHYAKDWDDFVANHLPQKPHDTDGQIPPPGITQARFFS